MKLKDLFSQKEFAEALGLAKLTVFKRQNPAHSKHVQPLTFGSRPKKGGGMRPVALAYTRRMVNQAKQGKFPIHPTEDEREKIIDVHEAAVIIYGEDSRKMQRRLSQELHKKRTIPFKKVGQAALMLRVDVEAFAAIPRRGPGRPSHK